LKASILGRGLTKQFNGVGLNGRMTFTLVEQVIEGVSGGTLDFE